MKLDSLNNLGLLLVRIALGGIMLIYGAPMMIPGGPPGDWLGFSRQLEHFEKTWAIPPLFGVLAIFAHFLGGLGLIVGLLTRLAALGIACAMGTATYFHIRDHAPLHTIEYPAMLCLVALGLMMLGAGGLSLDQAWFGKRSGGKKK
ncbi:MAG: DoxX family membrane protein [Fimbriimonadaceae bacterium]|nr:DoxX family membrane protein [Fimbriimonadaceae bacterium]